MITVISNKIEIEFGTGVPNGAFFTAQYSCIIFIYSANSINNTNIVARALSGSYTTNRVFVGGSGVSYQSCAKLEIGDFLTASGMSYPFKVVVFRYD